MSELFRKKSLIRISSPDKMDEYIKINTPSIWIILIAVLVFLAGFFIWAGLANLEDRIDVTGIQENGTLTCYVIGTESEGLSSDDVLLVNGAGYPLTSISESLMPISEIEDVYLASQYPASELIREVKASTPLEDGYYSTSIVTGKISPISFLFN